MSTKVRIGLALCFALLSTISQAQLPDSLVELYTFPKHEVYFELSYLVPTGAFGAKFDQFYDIDESLKFGETTGSNGFGATHGYIAEVGEYFYFNRTLSETAGGIKLTYASVSSTAFNWKGDGDYITNNADYKRIMTFGVKFGPCFRTVLAKSVAFRMFYQLSPTLGFHAGWNNELQYTLTDSIYVYDIDDKSSLKMNFGTKWKQEFGVALNFRNWLATAAINFGKMQYKKVDFSRYISITERGSGENKTLGGPSGGLSKVPFTWVAFSIAYRLPIW